tara:strand:- start:128 stop:823 length:696 start_codon:yes stop_codon:yes gene_type:complete
MSRIISYQYDNDIQDGDAWIGSEASTRQTKQYTAQAVANYLNINGKVSIGAQMVYKFLAVPYSGVGNFALTAGGSPVAYNAVTELAFSSNDRSGQETTAFLNYLVGSDILISQQKNISSFGHYTVGSYAQASAGYYNMQVTYNGGQGQMTSDLFYDVSNFILASGAGDKTFTFTQPTPSVQWTIQHNLNKFPSVSVVNNNNILMYGNTTYVDTNNLIITFTAGFSGKAYLN